MRLRFGCCNPYGLNTVTLGSGRPTPVDMLQILIHSASAIGMWTVEVIVTPLSTMGYTSVASVFR